MSDPQPQWRKVLLSGSNAHVNEITGSGVISAPTISGNTRRVLVIDTQSGAFYYSGSFGTGGNGNPGGSDTHIQYNDGGSFGGQSNFTFNKSSTVPTVTLQGGVGGGNQATLLITASNSAQAVLHLKSLRPQIRFSDFDGTPVHYFHQRGGKLVISDALGVDGPIAFTPSNGLISSSGRFITSEITASGNIESTGGNVVLGSNQHISFGNDSRRLRGGTDYLRLEGTNVIFLDANNFVSASPTLRVNDEINVGGDITATGSITSHDFIMIDEGSNTADLYISSSTSQRIRAVGQSGSNFAMLYTDSDGDPRVMLYATESVVSLSNRTPNGKVQIKASNGSGGGGTNEITVAEFEDEFIKFPILDTVASTGTNVVTIDISTGQLYVTGGYSEGGSGGVVTGYTNGANNRVITSTGTSTINAEGGLLFDTSTNLLQVGVNASNRVTFNVD